MPQRWSPARAQRRAPRAAPNPCTWPPPKAGIKRWEVKDFRVMKWDPWDGGESHKQQMYGDFVGFPREKKRALFGLVIR